jgi:hypothetical protein
VSGRIVISVKAAKSLIAHRQMCSEIVGDIRSTWAQYLFSICIARHHHNTIVDND